MQRPQGNIPSLIYVVLSGFTVLSGTTITHILNFSFNVAMGRMLTASEYSTVISLTSLLLLFSVFNKTVLLFVAKYVALFRRSYSIMAARGIFYIATRVSIVIGSAALIISLILAPVLAPLFKVSELYIVLFAHIVVLMFLRTITSGTFQGLQLFYLFSVSNVLEATVKLVASITFVLAGYTVGGVLVALLVAVLCTYVFSLERIVCFWGKMLGKQPLPRFVRNLSMLDVVRRVVSLKTGATTTFLAAGWASLGTTVLLSSHTVVAKYVLPPADAGLYAVLVVTSFIVYYGGRAFIAVMFPAVAEGQRLDGLSHTRTFHITLLVISVIICILLLLFYFFPHLILTALFGDKYVAASPYLITIGIAIAMLTISELFFMYFIAVSRYLFWIPLALSLVVYVVGLTVYHSSIADIITVLTASCGILLLMTAALYVWTYIVYDRRAQA